MDRLGDRGKFSQGPVDHSIRRLALSVTTWSPATYPSREGGTIGHRPLARTLRLLRQRRRAAPGMVSCRRWFPAWSIVVSTPGGSSRMCLPGATMFLVCRRTCQGRLWSAKTSSSERGTLPECDAHHCSRPGRSLRHLSWCCRYLHVANIAPLLTAAISCSFHIS